MACTTFSATLIHYFSTMCKILCQNMGWEHDTYSLVLWIDFQELWILFSIAVPLSKVNAWIYGILFGFQILQACWGSQVPLWYWCLFLQGPGDVWFSLNNKRYQKNSCVALEDIGENDTALLCMTNFTSCCTSTFTMTGSASGDWFFPNGTRILNGTTIPSVMVT